MADVGACPSSSAVFEEPEDPSNRSFFSEIISSISDVKFSHSGRYIMTRDYLTVKVWDLNMENQPIETYQVSGAQRGARGAGVYRCLPVSAAAGLCWPVRGLTRPSVPAGSRLPAEQALLAL